MAEKHAKARLLQQHEARDDKLRALFDELSREDAFGAIILFHRLIPRLDIQGVVPFNVPWLLTECFPEHPVTHAEVKRWREALVAVGLLEMFTEKGAPYAWTRSFYKNQPGLDPARERPRYPRPPGWQWNGSSAPTWAVGGRPAPAGGPDLEGAGFRAEIEELEAGIGTQLAHAIRTYALVLVSPRDRARRILPTSQYLSLLSTIVGWREAGAIKNRGRSLPWNDGVVLAALEETEAAMFLNGPLRSHNYLAAVIASGLAKLDGQAADAGLKQRLAEERAAAVEAARIDEWLANHPTDAEKIEKAVRKRLRAEQPDLPEDAPGNPQPLYRMLVRAGIRSMAHTTMGKTGGKS